MTTSLVQKQPKIDGLLTFKKTKLVIWVSFSETRSCSRTMIHAVNYPEYITETMKLKISSLFFSILLSFTLLSINTSNTINIWQQTVFTHFINLEPIWWLNKLSSYVNHGQDKYVHYHKCNVDLISASTIYMYTIICLSIWS